LNDEDDDEFDVEDSESDDEEGDEDDDEDEGPTDRDILKSFYEVSTVTLSWADRSSVRVCVLMDRNQRGN
jgi:hypothetical protein